MDFIEFLLVLLVGAEHLYIMGLEILIPGSEKVARIFGVDHKFLQDPIVQAMLKNQGLYNGIISFGIIFALITGNLAMTIFFLISVMVAAVYAGLTIKKELVIMQGLPALITLIVILF